MDTDFSNEEKCSFNCPIVLLFYLFLLIQFSLKLSRHSLMDDKYSRQAIVINEKNGIPFGPLALDLQNTREYNVQRRQRIYKV